MSWSRQRCCSSKRAELPKSLLPYLNRFNAAAADRIEADDDTLYTAKLRRWHITAIDLSA